MCHTFLDVALAPPGAPFELSLLHSIVERYITKIAGNSSTKCHAVSSAISPPTEGILFFGFSC